MPFPTFDDLFNPTLRALRELGGSASINELVEQVIEDQEYPPKITEQTRTADSRTRLEYRLAWARTYLKKFGLIDNSARGVWALTAKGRTVEEVDQKEVVRFVNRQASESTKKRRPDTELDNDEPIIEDDEVSTNWRIELQEVLRGMSPDAFERLCQRLLRESGFTEVEVTGRSGDGGIDGNGIVRLAGLLSFPVVFQCKRYREDNKIGAKTVRDFRGAMVGRADRGLIITTSGFTRDAKTEATRDGAPPVDLIDGEVLAEKLRELGLGISTKQVEAVEVDPSWFQEI